MAGRFFRYQSLDELEKEINALSLNVSFEHDPSKVRSYLNQPVKLGEVIAGNSIAIHPMEGCDGTLTGKPGNLTYRRYQRFGSGGAKLIWFEATAIVSEGRANPRQLLINDKNAQSFENLVRDTKRAHKQTFGTSRDLVLILQLTHSGRYSYPAPILCAHNPYLDRITSLGFRKEGVISSAYPLITDEYIENLEDSYAKAAKLAWEIGFTGVDIKLTHGYLGNELLGAKQREGRYGGSLNNRTRFLRNVIKKIRRNVGENFLLASRIGVFDGVPFRLNKIHGKGEVRPYRIPYLQGFGMDKKNPLESSLEEPIKVIRMMRESGVSLISISMGNPYTNPHIGRPFDKPDDGNYSSPEHPLIGVNRQFELCAQVQRTFPNLPIVGAGYSWLQHWQLHAGAANIRDRKVTIMGIGRGALAYPNLPKDGLEKGILDVRTTCKTLTFCTYLMRQKDHPLGQYPTGCPPFDKNIYGPLIKQSRSTKK